MKIHWNGFLKIAVKEYPKEACAFLFSKKPYSKEEEWFVFPVKNSHKSPEHYWKPNKKHMLKVKALAIKMGLTKIGNIHTHPHTSNDDIEDFYFPSKFDLSLARRFNDTIRGIIVVDNKTIHGIRFHDKFGKGIPMGVEED